METDPKHALIIAEDNPRDREYLINALQGYDLHVADCGRKALDISRTVPDAYLVSDLQLPGLSGVELARQLWADNTLLRIVFWSQYDDEVYVRALSRITPPETVYGYVLKNNPSSLLLRALHSVFEDNQCWIDPKIRSVQARNGNKTDLVSDAEYEVLIDIALGLTDNLIAKRRHLSRRGVQSRLKSLYEKLNVDRGSAEDGINPRSRAVAVALKRGLINSYELKLAEETLGKWMHNS